MIKVIGLSVLVGMTACTSEIHSTSSKKMWVEDSTCNKPIVDLGTLFKDSIKIIKVETSNPNSADGVDASVIWKNNSSRTIKYVRFEFAAYNAVNDEVYNTIGYGLYREGGKITGPIKPYVTYGYDNYWECLWYNSTILRAKVTEAQIEYMDGTKVTIAFT